ncbi:hypothetical protein SAMN04489844_1624 [Nocardioides exalbidus]|uniref:Uncharacterized protein n=1 Tax=Nocardioides exalbidus TaxID=402596 RepID=A0A1H4PJR9_9ACTN|nr:hypothetical protein SAMN04489844_1624 [Nocardioides exalbidus]
MVACGGGCSSSASVSWNEADGEVGNRAEVCGRLVSVSFDPGSEATFFNLGKDYPDPNRFTIVVWNSSKDLANDFRSATTEGGQKVCAEGDVSEYDGVAQIEFDSGDEDIVVESPSEEYEEEYPDISDEIPGPF